MSAELNRLRDEYRKARSSVTAKIGRTKRNTGAEVAGTKFDPRKPLGAEKRMNAATLRKRIGEMREFTNRNLQFVSGDSGAPIRRHVFNTYKRTEVEQNAVGAIHDDQMDAIKLPHRRNMSVGEARNQLNQGQGAAVYGPYKKFNREAINFPSEEAVIEARQNFLNVLTQKFLPTKLGQGKANLKKVLHRLNEHDMADKIDGLSDYQFDILWYGDPATIERLFVHYDSEKEIDEGRGKKWHEDAAEGAADDFGKFLGWVESEIPVERPENSSQIPERLTTTKPGRRRKR